jgi:hypothetical protein
VIETVEIAEEWLYATLSTDTALAALVSDRISGTLSPELLVMPYVTFLMQSSRDVSAVGGIRISTDNLYIVKAVAQTSTWDDLTPIASRIDYLIHRPGSVMIEGGGSLTCTRERVHQLAEVDEGLQYRQLGGVYRIRASAD